MFGGMGRCSEGDGRVGWNEGSGVRVPPKHCDHLLQPQASLESPKAWQTLICPLVQNGLGGQ